MELDSTKVLTYSTRMKTFWWTCIVSELVLQVFHHYTGININMQLQNWNEQCCRILTMTSKLPSHVLTKVMPQNEIYNILLKNQTWSSRVFLAAFISKFATSFDWREHYIPPPKNFHSEKSDVNIRVNEVRFIINKPVPLLSHLRRSLRINPGWLHVIFVVEKTHKSRCLLELLGFSPANQHSTFATHSSITYRRDMQSYGQATHHHIPGYGISKLFG
jgi:hypothetical protein